MLLCSLKKVIFNPDQFAKIEKLFSERAPISKCFNMYMYETHFNLFIIRNDKSKRDFSVLGLTKNKYIHDNYILQHGT